MRSAQRGKEVIRSPHAPDLGMHAFIRGTALTMRSVGLFYFVYIFFLFSSFLSDHPFFLSLVTITTK